MDSAPSITRRTSETKATKKIDRLKSGPLRHVVFPNPRSDTSQARVMEKNRMKN